MERVLAGSSEQLSSRFGPLSLLIKRRRTVLAVSHGSWLETHDGPKVSLNKPGWKESALLDLSRIYRAREHPSNCSGAIRFPVPFTLAPPTANGGRISD